MRPNVFARQRRCLAKPWRATSTKSCRWRTAKFPTSRPCRDCTFSPLRRKPSAAPAEGFFECLRPGYHPYYTDLPMAKRPDPADDPSGKLSDKVDDLTAAVEKLSDRVGILCDLVDRLRDDYSWALNNIDRLPCASSSYPLTSMPKDPLAADFGQRLNRFSA